MSRVSSMSIELTPERNADAGLRRRQQVIAQSRVAARQLRLRKTQCPVERLGDLFMRPALHVVQPDYRASDRGKPCQSAIEIDEIRGAAFRLCRCAPALLGPGLERDARAMPRR